MAIRKAETEDGEESLFVPETTPHVRPGLPPAAKDAPPADQKDPAYFTAGPKWKQPMEDSKQSLLRNEKAAGNGIQCLKNMLAILKGQKKESLSRIANLFADGIGLFILSFSCSSKACSPRVLLLILV